MENKDRSMEDSDAFYSNTLNRIQELEEEKKRLFKKNLPSYIWQVIKSILEILVFMAIISSTDYSGEGIIISILIFIYVYVRNLSSSLALIMVAQGIRLANDVFEIKNKLGVVSNNLNVQEELKEANLQYKKAEVNNYIRSITYAILLLMAIGNLLSNLNL